MAGKQLLTKVSKSNTNRVPSCTLISKPFPSIHNGKAQRNMLLRIIQIKSFCGILILSFWAILHRLFGNQLCNKERASDD